MIIVSGIQRLDPADLDRVREAARAVIAETRQEQGCLVYSFAEDMVEPGLLRVYEEWETRADLERHAKSDHVAAWRAALASVEVLHRELKIIEAGASEALG
ncbi:putative quinol monooxygenase [Aurantimonas sp. A2-1-M11]|uniref:putative quinol monooxygenase n=1 Tax=Aurantimonas sp. A2-1-M11 TaxID=3113712 RepID=UPI002F925C63